jgi:hypothetical protein
MAVQQVYIPEKRDQFGNLVGTVGQGANIYGAGKTFGWWGGGGGATTTGSTVGANAGQGMNLGVTPMKPVTEGMSGSLDPSYAGSSYTAPEVSTGGGNAAAGAGLDWGAGETAMSAAGPIGVGVGGMAFGAIADNDYRMKGDKAGNAPYANRGGPSLNAGPNEWGMDTISRKLSAKNVEPMNPFNFTDLRKTIEVMPLADIDKSNMLGKLTQMANLSKLFNVKKG